MAEAFVDTSMINFYVVEMDKRLIRYELNQVVEYLLSQNEPVNESRVIRSLAETHGYPSFGDVSIYTLHFSLYHALFKIKFSPEYSDYYVHTYTMFIRMLKLPTAGYCCSYNEQNGNFCSNGSLYYYCHKHSEEEKWQAAPVNAVMSRFYLDPENILFQDSCDLQDRMDRILLYGMCKSRVDYAFYVFGLDSKDYKLIKKRYRQLASKYHPDKGGSIDKMKEINESYALLKKIFS
ncbi:MAG: J domain-containing protein [Spirochaetes bacterium]|nr:J domain-containing protein [Spirochaetota bacterium]